MAEFVREHEVCENQVKTLWVSKFSSGKTVQNIKIIKKVEDWPQTAEFIREIGTWNMWGCDNCDITDDFCHLWTQNTEIHM